MSWTPNASYEEKLSTRRTQLGLEAGGKVKSNIREVRAIVMKMSPEQLRQAADELRQSIQVRSQEMIRLGEDTVRGATHRLRIDQERAILRTVEKKLGGN